MFIELWERADIANKAEADLFLSIHVNALTRSSAKGTLTLVLGQHRADENFDVAVRENSVILLEEDYETSYEGFNPKSTESYIMFSLMQKTYFKQSIEFGDYVQDQFRERAGRNDLGVREQGIYVLAQISMPGCTGGNRFYFKCRRREIPDVRIWAGYHCLRNLQGIQGI